MYLIGLNFRGFFPCGVWLFFFRLRASIWISLKIIWLFGLKPQAFIMNGTLRRTTAMVFLESQLSDNKATERVAKGQTSKVSGIFVALDG